MPPSEGVDLDQLLRDKRLYDENSHSKDNRLRVGAAEHTMEIVTPRGRKVVTWIGRLVGRTGKVADLVMGRG